MVYYTTLTNTALAKISAALAAGTTLTMSEMAVGDGNGAETNPTPTDTGLVNEVYRAAVNQVGVNGDGYLVAEMVIPADEGGFSVREIALFDSDGDTEWADPTQINVVVDTIEESQTLAAGQTVVTFTTVTHSR